MADAKAVQALTSIKYIINQGINELDLEISDAQEVALAQYLLLLEKWNKVYNLTAIRDVRQMVVQHVLDSLIVIPHLPLQESGVRLLDVGSGAGLPAVPIAVACPNVRVTMLDSNQKKSAFMMHAVGELGLANAKVVDARVEDWSCEEPFQIIISRAYSECSKSKAEDRQFFHSKTEVTSQKRQ